MDSQFLSCENRDLRLQDTTRYMLPEGLRINKFQKSKTRFQKLGELVGNTGSWQPCVQTVAFHKPDCAVKYNDELELLLGLGAHTQIFLLKSKLYLVVTWLFQSKTGATAFMHLNLGVDECCLFSNKHDDPFLGETQKAPNTEADISFPKTDHRTKRYHLTLFTMLCLVPKSFLLRNLSTWPCITFL